MAKHFSIGDRVGPYRLEKHLGGGGASDVFDAVAEDGRVALKLFRTVGMSHSTMSAVALRELRAGKSVDSSRVSRPMHWNLDSDPLWIAYQPVQGQSLQERIATAPVRRLRLEEVMSVFRDVALGLAAIHRAGIVAHRDVKPANIMVTPQHEAVLLDLGASVLGEGSPLTQNGWGTDGYRAPEQIFSTEVSHASDVWSLGACMVEAACGHKPFGSPYDSVYLDRLRGRPSLVGLPLRLVDLVESCLHRDPLKRPTADQVVASLDRPSAWSWYVTAVKDAPVTMVGMQPDGRVLFRYQTEPVVLLDDNTISDSTVPWMPLHLPGDLVPIRGESGERAQAGITVGRIHHPVSLRTAVETFSPGHFPTNCFGCRAELVTQPYSATVRCPTENCSVLVTTKLWQLMRRVDEAFAPGSRAEIGTRHFELLHSLAQMGHIRDLGDLASRDITCRPEDTAEEEDLKSFQQRLLKMNERPLVMRLVSHDGTAGSQGGRRFKTIDTLARLSKQLAVPEKAIEGESNGRYASFFTSLLDLGLTPLVIRRLERARKAVPEQKPPIG